MHWNDWLAVLANTASIVTAGVAAWAYIQYRLRWAKKVKKLEDYLRNETAAGVDKGERTITHLIRELGMTEADILHCASESKVIDRRISMDEETGQAKILHLVYQGHA